MGNWWYLVCYNCKEYVNMYKNITPIHLFEQCKHNEWLEEEVKAFSHEDWPCRCYFVRALAFYVKHHKHDINSLDEGGDLPWDDEKGWKELFGDVSE